MARQPLPLESILLKKLTLDSSRLLFQHLFGDNNHTGSISRSMFMRRRTNLDVKLPKARHPELRSSARLILRILHIVEDFISMVFCMLLLSHSIDNDLKSLIL